MIQPDLLNFIEKTERAHLRTEHDTGANFNALLLWNQVREFAGLPKIRRHDLPEGPMYQERPYPRMPREDGFVSRHKRPLQPGDHVELSQPPQYVEQHFGKVVEREGKLVVERYKNDSAGKQIIDPHLDKWKASR